MASPAQSRPQFQFGVYTVDLQACELRKLGSRIVLQERPFQLLLALLERPGEVVTREELRRQKCRRASRRPAAPTPYSGR